MKIKARKLLRIASHLSIASVCFTSGMLFIGDFRLFVCLFFAVSAGTLLTATSVLYMLESNRALNEANALELRCRVMDRWCELLIVEQIKGRMRDAPVELRGTQH